MDALKVACVLRSGGDFTAEHVALLRDQVARFRPGVRFVCFSDVAVPCERIALRHRGWRGFWAKLELFRELTGPTLYFDLDSLLLADPAPLIGAGEFVMIRHWIHADRFASGVMYWDGDFSHVYRAFSPRLIRRYMQTMKRYGDQGFIQDVLGERITAFPEGTVVSFKRQCKAGVPDGAVVVAFHGRPRPWNAAEKWVRSHYEHASAA
ncbi:MAG TPA: hypothetical protein VFY80_06265 [Burkholderiales bacterium]|nr:hypothetical protein [Burkholderiales bacterium]